MPSQKELFLQSEGDAWYERNEQSLLNRNFFINDEIVNIIREYIKPEAGNNLLEIGCGEGGRLYWLQEEMGLVCCGIEPSKKAAQIGNQKCINIKIGTADNLPFPNNSFNIIIFGHCLYLCDRDDLFKIAAEAHRVLEDNGWIIIHDFYSQAHSSNQYVHKKGILSYKMDYQSMFTWHPNYVTVFHNIYDQSLSLRQKKLFTDNPDEWVAITVLRKKV